MKVEEGWRFEIRSSNVATNSMACTTYFKNNSEAASHYFTVPNAGEQRGLPKPATKWLPKKRPSLREKWFIYHSERFNTRATHIQCCPRQPQEIAGRLFGRELPAKRVRGATASGSV